MAKPLDRTGRRYGRLTCIRLVIEDGKRKWLCQCDCGNTKIAKGISLGWTTKSCGCLRRETAAATAKDYRGRKFGRLTVIERAKNVDRKTTAWKCMCDCGREAIVRTGGLVTGNTKSCGCQRGVRGIKNLSGRKYGRLTVVELSGSKLCGSQRVTMWKCLCECGAEATVRSGSLQSGLTRSCGCLKLEKSGQNMSSFNKSQSDLGMFLTMGAINDELDKAN